MCREYEKNVIKREVQQQNFLCSDERRKALLQEVYSEPPSTQPLPADVLEISKVFDWSDPYKIDSHKAGKAVISHA